jgi:hypothetical protein
MERLTIYSPPTPLYQIERGTRRKENMNNISLKINKHHISISPFSTGREGLGMSTILTT